MIYTVWVGYSVDGVDRLSNGELFIGTANDDGTHASEGHAFGSRPSALDFSYKYESLNKENFYVRVEIKASDGTVIATGETTAGPASASWDGYTLPLNYTDMSRKAASIYIIFKSTSSSNPTYTSRSFTVGGNTYSSGCNIGSVLYIDDLELIYD